MATSNFYMTRTSKIYAFGMDKYYTQEDVDYGRVDADMVGEFDDVRTEEDYYYTIDYARELLEIRGYTIDNDRGADFGNGSCYYGMGIAYKSQTIRVAGLEIDLTIKIGYIGAYYEGACFDAYVSATVMDARDKWQGYVASYENADEITETEIVAENFCGNKGLSKIQAGNIARRVSDAVARLRMEAEEVFEQCCEERLGVVATGGNGETVYKRI